MKIFSVFVTFALTSVAAKGPKPKTDAPPEPPLECDTPMQTIKVAAAWDWALCDYVKGVGDVGPCEDPTDIGRTTCYAEVLIATANMAFNAPPLCVNLEVQIIPDNACIQAGSKYASMDVASTSYSGFVSTFQNALPPGLDRAQLQHMLAGSDVGTNIGAADYSTLCNPNPGAGASWVRGGKWHYFAHELAHQLGVEFHLKGKEAKQGDFIMENFVQDGEFSRTSMAAMKSYIEPTVNLDGTCK